MRSAMLRIRASRLLVAALFLFAAALAASAQTTTFTGKVYSPLGTAGDPIPNILAFIQDPNSPLPVFSQGVAIPTGGQTGCEAQPNLVPATVLGQALTDASGTYSFTVTGQLPTTINFVIQAGKWRLQTQFPSSQFTLGQVNQMPPLSMPSQQGPAADLPHIAVVTGSADNIECIFRQIGIKDSEVTDPTGGGSINLFVGDGSGGEAVSSSSPNELKLVNPAASGAVPITNYDLVMFGCQGDSTSDSDPASYTSTIENYTSNGGRIFLTHYEYPWLRDSTAFGPIADWYTPKSKESATGDETGELSPSFSGYPILSAWMQNIGALNISTTPPEFTLSTVREDATAVHAPAQIWATVPAAPYNGAAVQFSFDTPLGASGTPTLGITYTNNATQYLRGSTSNTISLTITNSGTIATTSGLSLAITLPSSIIATQAAGGGWVCTVSNPITQCKLPAAIAPASSNTLLLTFNIPSSATLGSASITALLSGGGLNNSGQCGRVLYNDYHVESSSKKGSLYKSGANCDSSSSLSVAQKFLEYSLYNLSNFISPSTTDTLLIQDYAPLAWTPPATYPYGTPKSTIQSASSTVDGQWTYAYTPTAVDPPNALAGGAAYTIVANFTPTDTTDYLGNSLTRILTITPDQTDAIITNLENPIYYGEEIGYDPRPGVGTGDAVLGVYITAGYTPWIGSSPATGPYSLTLAGKVVCTGAEETGINDPSRQTACPDSNFQGYDVGQYAMQLTYLGNTNFIGSISDASKTIVVVNPDPTSTALSLSSATAVVHDTATVSATVTQTISYVNTLPVGTVTFYESTNPIAANTSNTAAPIAGSATLGTVTLDATGKATLPLASLLVGTHNLYACFTSAINKSGTKNFQPSCTASSPQTIITPPPAPLLTATLLRTSADPSPQGAAVSFTANVETTGAFVITPGGTVTFYDGTTSIGTATLDATGSAVLTTSSLALGTHIISVSYGGSSIMAASTSATLNEIIVDPLTAAGTGFLLQIAPTTVPVFVGSTGTATVQVVALTNFNEPVELTCSGLPAQSSCLFAQSIIPVGGGTTQLLLSSGSPHACDNDTPFLSTMGGSSSLSLLLLSTLTLCFARRRRKLQGIALAALLLVLPGMLAGCSGSNCTDFAVKPGDYSFTITAHSTGTQNITRTQTMVMHVHL
jgi:hypothetical protein